MDRAQRQTILDESNSSSGEGQASGSSSSGSKIDAKLFNEAVPVTSTIPPSNSSNNSSASASGNEPSGPSPSGSNSGSHSDSSSPRPEVPDLSRPGLRETDPSPEANLLKPWQASPSPQLSSSASPSPPPSQPRALYGHSSSHSSSKGNESGAYFGNFMDAPTGLTPPPLHSDSHSHSHSQPQSAFSHAPSSGFSQTAQRYATYTQQQPNYAQQSPQSSYMMPWNDGSWTMGGLSSSPMMVQPSPNNSRSPQLSSAPVQVNAMMTGSPNMAPMLPSQSQRIPKKEDLSSAGATSSTGSTSTSNSAHSHSHSSSTDAFFNNRHFSSSSPANSAPSMSMSMSTSPSPNSALQGSSNATSGSVSHSSANQSGSSSSKSRSQSPPNSNDNNNGNGYSSSSPAVPPGLAFQPSPSPPAQSPSAMNGSYNGFYQPLNGSGHSQSPSNYISTEGLVNVPGVGYVTSEFFQMLPVSSQQQSMQQRFNASSNTNSPNTMNGNHQASPSNPNFDNGERPAKRMRVENSFSAPNRQLVQQQQIQHQQMLQQHLQIQQYHQQQQQHHQQQQQQMQQQYQQQLHQMQQQHHTQLAQHHAPHHNNMQQGAQLHHSQSHSHSPASFSNPSPPSAPTFLCPYDGCGKAFHTLQTLKKHEKMTHHDPGAELPDYFDEHEQGVREDTAGNGEFRCPKEGCARTFTQEKFLQIHLKSHPQNPNSVQNIARFQCSHPGCNYSTPRKHNLDVHLRSHTGERPYMCKVPGCNKTFKDAGYLKRHERVHTKDKPYLCQICQQSFSWSTSLANHVARDHPQ